MEIFSKYTRFFEQYNDEFNTEVETRGIFVYKEGIVDDILKMIA